MKRDLVRREANHVALTPLDFLARSADVMPEKVAIVDGERRFTYAAFEERAARLAGALVARGLRDGDVVSVLAPNCAEMLEAHFGVPLAGGILNALNTRLDPPAIASILRHAGSRFLIVHSSMLGPGTASSAALEGSRPELIVIGVPEVERASVAGEDYEAMLATAVRHPRRGPRDEWDSIALNYTSGTTGRPKGALYSHRGAYLNALGNVITFGLRPDAVYLWTLPMFHCNGWTYPWAVTAIGARHICLPAVDPARIFRLIVEEGVTHLCAAPVVLTMLIHAPEAAGLRLSREVEVATGGAAPPSAVIEAMERMGFRLTHLYGMTESYGPSTSCLPQPDWSELPLADRARLMARQGVRNLTLQMQDVIDAETGAPVPRDGTTLGELVLRGNTVMKGYLDASEETENALSGGWLHTGDLAVVHPDGYIEIKDRSKDIIISGGENISSLEVEEALYRHPAVMEAAVVARPDPKWGETPCAFVTLKAETGPVTEDEIIAFCRERLARFKCPRSVVFGPLPKTSTGKIQKYELRRRAAEL
jgi:fatty-acyl-CoA synthase